jgi:tetratricopeptide (TPR) repeat protein
MHSFGAVRFRLHYVLALIAFFAPYPALGQPADPVARAKALVEQKDSRAAYELLSPLESRYAGNIEFDYWLGAAALDSGHLERAVIAFERVLVTNPDFDSARLELGRAYLRMGALDLAEQEFTRLLAPNDTGRALLNDYLAEIRRIKDRQRYAVSGFVEVGGGRDSNLSSSTRDFPGAILASFGLPGIEPTGNSIRRADNYLAANAGVDVLYRLREDRAIFAVADLRWRGYRSFGEYDYVLGDAAAGYRARVGELTYSAVAFLQSFRQDGAFVDTISSARITNDRDSFGMSFEVHRALNASTDVALGTQLAAYRYRTNPGQDTRQVTMSLALENRPEWWRDASLSARIFYGYDDARRPLNDFTDTTASRHTFGLRVIGQTDPRAAVSWQTALGWSRRIDDDNFARATLVPTGRDDLFEVFVKGSWRMGEAWSLQPYAIYVYNRSNIDLYTFRKAEGGVMLRRDFR